jgi:hypothetical protein
MGLIGCWTFGRVVSRCFALVAVLIMLGCAESPPQPERQIVERAPGASAKLVVANVSGPTLIASNLDVVDNGDPLVSLPRQTYRAIWIAPGAHEFRFAQWPTGARFARLEAELGVTYYLVVGYSPARSMAFPFAGDSMAIRIVTGEQGRQLMKEMRPD